ncbi:MAG: YgjV family protein [Clostridia bacterium]|nr:YgjV family protein [Clostridia bacterium]
MPPCEIIGQVIGIFGVVVLFLAYQMKVKKTLLLLQMIGIALLSIQYFLINALSGAVLNVVCFIRTLFFYFTEEKIKNEKLKTYVFPLFFAGLICVFGAFSWEGWYSILMLVCLAINSFCTGACNPQNFRKSLLFTCTLALAYNVIVFSIGGMLNEIVSMISAAIGIARYKKERMVNSKG